MAVNLSSKAPAKKKKRNIRVDERHALWQLLRRTALAIGKAREKELEELGISVEMSALLMTIVTIAALRTRAIPAAIAKTLLLEPNTVSQQLSKMEKMGLVHKTKNLERKNLVRVELTEAGRELLHKSIERRRSIRKIMSVLTEDERRQMWNSLAKLRDAAIKELGVRKPILYPPSDISELAELYPYD